MCAWAEQVDRQEDGAHAGEEERAKVGNIVGECTYGNQECDHQCKAGGQERPPMLLALQQIDVDKAGSNAHKEQGRQRFGGHRREGVEQDHDG